MTEPVVPSRAPTQPVGSWRASYSPGEWIVLSGPTSLVALPVSSPKWSALISTLWDEVVASSSIVEVASRLATYRIDALPSFVALFWTADGMRSLVRGAVVIHDLDSGDVIADGESIQTWTEAGLDEVRRVSIDLDNSDASPGPLELPLVVGAVRASAVNLDATDAAIVRSPQGVAAVEPEADAIAGVTDGDDLDDTLDTEPMPPVAKGSDGLVHEVEWGEWGTDGEPTEALTSDELDALSAVGSGSEAAQAVDENDPPDVAASDGDRSDPAARHEASDDSAPAEVPPDEVAEVDDADTAVMPLPLVPPLPLVEPLPTGQPSTLAADFADSLAAPPAPDEARILAALCALGHSNSPEVTACRICGAIVPPQSPQLVSRPVIASLRSPDGSVVDLDRVVLIGRAPAESASDADLPRLMTVASPGHDISRTHLQVSPDGWEIVVIDLHSTNGTMWVSPGAGQQLLQPGTPTPVPIGTSLELGDGVTVVIEPAQ
jgi:hypothetical protein